MNLLKTRVNPNHYKNEIGNVVEIYTTTLSYPATILIIFALGAFFFGGFGLVGRMLILSVPAYILLNPRFRYISVHEKGLLLKKRFSFKIIKLEEIERIELRNMSIFWNMFRSGNNKIYGLDIYLKDGNRYSYGERERVFAGLRYPRLDSLTCVHQIQELKSHVSRIMETPAN